MSNVSHQTSRKRLPTRSRPSSDAWSIVYEQHGGNEIYAFLSNIVVLHPNYDHQCIKSLRAVDTQFKSAVDGYILELMPQLNNRISQYYNLLFNMCKLKSGRLIALSVNADQRWKDRVKSAEVETDECRRQLSSKLSWHSMESLKKCLNQHIIGRVSSETYRSNNGLDPEEVIRVPCSVNSFLNISAAHACNFHSNERCECFQTWGGSFSFVPYGRGLVVRCAKSCLLQNCVEVRCFRSDPISVPNKKMNSRNLSMAQSMMSVAGVHAPFSISALKARIGEAGWQRYLYDPYLELRRLNPRMTDGIAVLTLSSSIVADDGQAFNDGYRIPTFQTLLKLSDEKIKMARRSLDNADYVVFKAREQARVLMQSYATNEFLQLLNLHLSNDASSDIVFDSLDQLDARFPGSKIIINRSVIDHAAQTPLQEIYELHLTNRPFTLNILNTIRFAAIHLYEHDMKTFGSCASTRAYSFATGLCSGLDPSHDFRNLNHQLKFGLYGDVASNHVLDAAVAFLYAFDTVVPESVRLSNVCDPDTASRHREFLRVTDSSKICEFEFEMAGVRVCGPTVFFAESWASDIQTKLEAAKRLWEAHCSSSSSQADYKRFQELPSSFNPHASGWETVLEVLQCNVRFFMQYEETRATAFDMMTGSRTKTIVYDVLEADPVLTTNIVQSIGKQQIR